MSDLTRKAAAPRWPEHFPVVTLCFAAAFICYVDRANISVAAIAMKEEFGWSETAKGLVLSSFFVGYIMLQTVSGALAHRYGGKIVLGLAVVWWSIFTLLTPAAAFASLPVLIAARITMGLGEAAMFPAAYTMMGCWVPAAQRTRAVAFVMSGVSLGTVFVLPTTGLLIRHFGWPWAFYVYGLVGLVWAAIWFARVGNSPPPDPECAPESNTVLASTDAGRDPSPPIPWRVILSAPSVWAVIVAHFCNNWALYMLLAWLPSYFRATYGVDIATAGQYSAGPFLTMFAMTQLAGWSADRLSARGVPASLVRKSMVSITLLGAGLFLVLARGAASPTAGLVLMCGAAGSLGCGPSGYCSNVFDIAPRHGDVVFGISNTFATIPGIVGVAVTGWLIDATGTYAAPFLLTASICLVGSLVFLGLASGRRIIA